MFSTLKIGTKVYLGLALFLITLSVLFFQMSWWSLLALTFSTYQFYLLFESFGKVIPIRNLLGSFMCLQMLIGPALAYNGLDQYQVGHFRMQVTEADYFFYVLPAVVLFVLGLNIRAGNYEGEKVDFDKLDQYISNHKTLPYIFIAVGFVATYLSQWTGPGLTFLLYLIGGLKFIGLFLIILTKKQLNYFTTILVYGSVIISSITSAMFHDLLTWGIFLIAVFCLKYNPTRGIKLFGLMIFVFLSVFIQLIKGDYREVTWRYDKEGDFETLGETVQQQVTNQELFALERIAQNNIRINQGAIISNIMKYIPDKKPFAEGSELLDVVESAFLPRIVSENKINAGDRDFFMKWSGMIIGRGASMGLSSVGDAYINFGVFGGMIFMFLYGLFFNEVLLFLSRKTSYYPILMIITPLIFYYPIRADGELHTLLGHLVKSCFLIFVLIQFWKSFFYLNDQKVIQPR